MLAILGGLASSVASLASSLSGDDANVVGTLLYGACIVTNLYGLRFITALLLVRWARSQVNVIDRRMAVNQVNADAGDRLIQVVRSELQHMMASGAFSLVALRQLEVRLGEAEVAAARTRADVLRTRRRQGFVGLLVLAAEGLAGLSLRGLYERRRRGAALHGSRALTSVALAIAGRRRSHLRDAWYADLAGAPEEGLAVTPRRRLLLASGFLVAGLKLRAADLSRPLWIPVDWLLVRKSRTRTAITAVVASVAIYIDVTGGLNQLLSNGVESCSIIATALGTLAHWLRRRRGIELSSTATDDLP
uniref:hypothetical protein n=1 Tax=Kitasatospora indigofera TaxID=67307 RepID=UPI002F910875